jgi:Protein of unknown function (DUF3455)
MHKANRTALSATLLVVASALSGFSAIAQQVPQNLQPPASEQLLLQVHAKGDQVYTCKADGTQFSRTLKEPDAQLFDKDGKPFGKHSPVPRGKPATVAASLAKPRLTRLPLTAIRSRGCWSR